MRTDFLKLSIHSTVLDACVALAINKDWQKYIVVPWNGSIKGMSCSWLCQFSHLEAKEWEIACKNGLWSLEACTAEDFVHFPCIQAVTIVFPVEQALLWLKLFRPFLLPCILFLSFCVHFYLDAVPRLRSSSVYRAWSDSTAWLGRHRSLGVSKSDQYKHNSVNRDRDLDTTPPRFLAV